MNKRVKGILIFTVIELIIFIICSGIAYFIGFSGGEKRGLEHKTIIVHTNFEDTSLTIESEDYRYQFLPKEMSDYICLLSKELNIDPNLPIAHLMVENPKFNMEAVHKNENGSMDLGLFQLNDAYLYKTFIPSYWDMDVEFNPFNWKHNTFIACHLIQDLNESVKVMDDAIMAYNCGLGRVMNNEIPTSTYEYLAAVRNNLKLLSEIGK